MSHEWVIMAIIPLCTTNFIPDVIGYEHRSGMLPQVLLGLALIPLSSFYGLLDILSGTELNPGQRETGRISLHTSRQRSHCSSVQTAKESCELLLKVVTN